MPDEAYSFAQARTRLEEIVTQVRKKDVSLETSLDLLEEGVRLASQCTELIDSADWDPSTDAAVAADAPSDPAGSEVGGAADTEGTASSDAEASEAEDEEPGDAAD